MIDDEGEDGGVSLVITAEPIFSFVVFVCESGRGWSWVTALKVGSVVEGVYVVVAVSEVVVRREGAPVREGKWKGWWFVWEERVGNFFLLFFPFCF